MTRYLPIAIVVLAFWLGTETAAKRPDQNVILLRDGDWTTKIQAGEILLEGPNGAFVLLTIGDVLKVMNKPTRRTEPRVLVSGPSDDSSLPPAFVAMKTTRSGASIAMSCPATADQPHVKDGKVLTPFASLAATIQGGASLRLMEHGKTLVRLSTEKELRK